MEMEVVDTPELLEAFVDRAIKVPSVAIDTEFMTEKVYYPRLSLIQIALEGGEIFFIDPLSVRDLRPLGRLLEHEEVVKVLHAASHDLELLQQATKVIPKNIFDTQHAAAFSGFWWPISLADLIAELFDIEMDKSETLSVWLRRPLSAEQCAYAAEDVRYLCKAYRMLLQDVKNHGHEAWLADEMSRYSTAERYKPGDPMEAYLRLKKIKSYTGEQLAAIQGIAAWREELARIENVPCSRILSDRAIHNIVAQMPSKRSWLQRIRGLPRHFSDEYAREVFSIIQKVREMPPESYPSLPEGLPSDEDFRARTYLAMALVMGQSIVMGIAPGLVARNPEIQAFVAGRESILSTGWRYEFMGRPLEELLKGQRICGVDSELSLPTILD